ncbi:TetR/AcrR family transcriptional regulator [Caenimonas aquaedulcis]|uniref:TetR/AcrR family transcriptional regulator n=1 Tax=Caenimonas aquaedulcis TaxID=2793270 RepID=A0A931H8F4_9BURK|nr:TetR/AcrR family transcriptional regulator [Caenimonas aquaedulcis]MBG9390448.1 TetR/AcrR family transcriptional regulator [Caenimonas aquaedulcis]
MPPLPPALETALASRVGAAPKRERTRRQLLLAAMQVYRQRGVAGATLQDIAAGAGVASGTVYNYFQTREEVAQQVATWLADTLCQRISESYASVKRGVERMAIGNRRYMWLAAESPEWALLLLEVGAAVPALAQTVHDYALADLRLGIRQKSFRPVSEAAAMDVINGSVSSAMASIARGHAPKGHASAVAASVLRALGVDAQEAVAVASLPLPDFPMQAAGELPGDAPPVRSRAARKGTRAP